MTKVKCNGCGYTGGPDGQDWEVTASSYAWGRCPKCGTTNLEVEETCETCGEKKHHGIYGIEPCKKCKDDSSEKGKTL